MAEATLQDVTCQALSAINILKTHSANLLESRTKLQQKSYQTKEEIYAAISRQLEALRDREVWLLTQVDTITQLKEEAIQERLTSATEGLVLLQEKLDVVQRNPDLPLSDLFNTIQRLRDLDHVPMEDPDVYFEAKGDKLRRKIHSFGSVSSSSKRPRLDKYASANQMTPANLPFMMKGLGLTDPNELFAVFNEPRPTTYWLQKKQGEEPQRSWHTSDTISTPFDAGLTVSQWLVKDAPPRGEYPEEDVTVEMTPVNHQEASPDISSGVQERMEAILSSPMEMWLFKDEERKMTPSNQEPAASNVSEESQDWLMVESVEDDELSQCACIASGERPLDMDIENLASLLCVQQHQPHAGGDASDFSSWLVRDESRSEERPRVSSRCRANETCQSFSECLCDDNCAGNPAESSEVDSPWLVQSDDVSVNVLRRFDEEFVASQWLVQESKNSSESVVTVKSECPEGSEWLACLEEKESSLPQEIDVSLTEKSSVTDDSYEKDGFLSVEKYHSSMTKMSDWLNSLGEKKMWLTKEEGDYNSSKDSNKWLVEAEESKDWLQQSNHGKSQSLDLSVFKEKLSVKEWLATN